MAALTINGRVFQLLIDQKRKQKELANFLELNERNIATWKGRGTDPPAKLAFQIAEFFGVSVEWLLTGKERPHTAFVNNGSVSSNLGQHYGTLIVRNGGERVLSNECAELVRIYESLGIKQRISLLNAAFDLEKGRSPAKQN